MQTGLALICPATCPSPSDLGHDAAAGVRRFCHCCGCRCCRCTAAQNADPARRDLPSNMSFASLTLAAMKLLPPASGWFATMSFLCASLMRSCSSAMQRFDSSHGASWNNCWQSRTKYNGSPAGCCSNPTARQPSKRAELCVCPGEYRSPPLPLIPARPGSALPPAASFLTGSHPAAAACVSGLNGSCSHPVSARTNRAPCQCI